MLVACLELAQSLGRIGGYPDFDVVDSGCLVADQIEHQSRVGKMAMGMGLLCFQIASRAIV